MRTLAAVLLFLPAFNGLFAENFSIENPSSVLERINQYVRSGEIYGNMHEFSNDLTKDMLGNMTSENLYFTKLTYSLSHDSAECQYILKDTVGKNNPSVANGLYKGICFRVFKDGKCKISGLINGSLTPEGRLSMEVASPGRRSGKSTFVNYSKDEINAKIEDGPVKNIEENLNLVEKFFSKTGMDKNLVLKNLREENGAACYSGPKSEILTQIIIGKIPEKISPENLTLFSIENRFEDKILEIQYCVRPTIHRESLRDVSFYVLSFKIDDKGACHFNGMKNGADNRAEVPSKKVPEKISQEELNDICEVVFRHMFQKGENWDKDIKIRFLSKSFGERFFPDDFFMRFKDENIPVASPQIKGKNYPEELFPDGRDSLFYYIHGIFQLDDSHIFVDCSISWRFLASRGYSCLLEKKDEKWQVVMFKKTWIS